MNPYVGPIAYILDLAHHNPWGFVLLAGVAVFCLLAVFIDPIVRGRDR